MLWFFIYFLRTSLNVTDPASRVNASSLPPLIPSYSPFSLSCLTVKAISSSSCSSLVCVDLRPVATDALGLRPAYMTCFRSWCVVWFSRVSIRGWVKLQAPALRGSSWHQTMVLALGYWSRFSRSCCHGKGCNCSMRVTATLSMLCSARCLWRAVYTWPEQRMTRSISSWGLMAPVSWAGSGMIQWNWESPVNSSMLERAMG